MPGKPVKNPEESSEHADDQKHIPFDGFVNVNDIVEKRRRLRNAEFNISDKSWDADLNLSPDDQESQS